MSSAERRTWLSPANSSPKMQNACIFEDGHLKLWRGGWFRDYYHLDTPTIYYYSSIVLLSIYDYPPACPSVSLYFVLFLLTWSLNLKFKTNLCMMSHLTPSITRGGFWANVIRTSTYSEVLAMESGVACCTISTTYIIWYSYVLSTISRDT